MNLSDVEVRLGRDRTVLLALIIVSLLASLCWAGLVLGGLVLASQPLADAAASAAAAGAVTAGAVTATPASAVPSLAYQAAQLALVFLTWAGLCTALMLPLASRATVLFARLAGHRAAQRARLRTALFVLGYLGAWTGFALLAAIVQWTLHESAPSGAVRHPLLLGLAMVAAGVYQWTPAKHACLEHCRAPIDPEAGEFFGAVARAHAQQQAAVADAVQGQRRLGHVQRVAQRQHDGAAGQHDIVRHRRQRGQPQERIVQRRNLARAALRDHQRHVAGPEGCKAQAIGLARMALRQVEVGQGAGLASDGRHQPHRQAPRDEQLPVCPVEVAHIR